MFLPIQIVVLLFYVCVSLTRANCFFSGTGVPLTDSMSALFDYK